MCSFPKTVDNLFKEMMICFGNGLNISFSITGHSYLAMESFYLLESLLELFPIIIIIG